MNENPEPKGQNEGFIPFNQSTPIQGGWQRRNYYQGFQNRNQSGGFRRSNSGGGYKNRWNNSRGNSSFEAVTSGRCNLHQMQPRATHFASDGHGQSFRDDISAYLHPSMLQDPWENLRRKNQS